MNKIIKIAFTFFIINFATCLTAEKAQIELVESVPVETMLDIDSLRNTPEVSVPPYTALLHGWYQAVSVKTL